jgi:hypothetical protein
MNLRRAVAAAFSWPRVAIAEGFAFLLISLEWLGLDADDRFSRYMAVHTFSRMLAALLVLLAIGLAEEATRRGAPKILSFAIAAIAPSLVSALIFTLLWFDMSWRTEHSVVLFFLATTMETALWVSLALIVLDNSAQTALIRESVKQVQMKRVQMERGVLESRLDAARSQIDGPALFQELTEIRDGLQDGEPRAAEALERLIQRLRSSAKGVT